MVIFEKGDIRISLITSRLLRVEKGGFTDLKTQTVVNRDFENPEYKIEQNDKFVEVSTNAMSVRIRLSDGKVVYATSLLYYAIRLQTSARYGENP